MWSHVVFIWCAFIHLWILLDLFFVVFSLLCSHQKLIFFLNNIWLACPSLFSRKRLLIVKNEFVHVHYRFRIWTAKEETAVRGALPILSRLDREAVGMGQGGGGAFHTPHWVWKGRRVQTVKSALYVMQGRSKRAQMGNQTDGIIESLKNRTSVITNLDEAVFFFLTFIYSFHNHRGLIVRNEHVCSAWLNPNQQLNKKNNN